MYIQRQSGTGLQTQGDKYGANKASKELGLVGQMNQ